MVHVGGNAQAGRHSSVWHCPLTAAPPLSGDNHRQSQFVPARVCAEKPFSGRQHATISKRPAEYESAGLFRLTLTSAPGCPALQVRRPSVHSLRNCPDLAANLTGTRPSCVVVRGPNLAIRRGAECPACRRFRLHGGFLVQGATGMQELFAGILRIWWLSPTSLSASTCCPRKSCCLSTDKGVAVRVGR